MKERYHLYTLWRRDRPSEDPESRRIGQAAEKLDDELNTYIATHAKQECMTLSKMMQSKLPRELRDMVYAHLLSRETYTVERKKNELYWLCPLRQISCDHLFTRGYVPLDTMKEIGEMWYKVSTFIVCASDIPERASEALNFLHDDTWGLDIDVYQHVKHIYVGFDYIHGVDEILGHLNANLRKLLSLGANARVVLYLQCEHKPWSTLREQQIIAFVRKLRPIFPVLEELVKEGKRIMVNVKGHDVFEVKVETLNAPSWISQLSQMLSDKDLNDIPSYKLK
ncbi:hypothetical protein J4E83_010851 [Alternaria metachromatica]|uniref:uncharacterized protein n=1 Tax=Alternaria metachromatica TaxID=283354 RepID=UPI0020C23D50|nr:uncharacterized protein J4E83_010851 [Alternaria metachromatica]KAI4605115.1 hypothetical protein J4E83_010851 [Alternaria metachromatica]